MSELVPISVAVKLLGVTAPTLRAWDKAGKLVAIRLPSGHRRYRLSDLEAIVNG